MLHFARDLLYFPRLGEAGWQGVLFFAGRLAGRGRKEGHREKHFRRELEF
jgi:hypothetical protein